MTFSLDFRPRRDGLPYDPVQFGGSVDLVRVFSDAARTVLVQTAGPAARISAGLYRFTLNNLADGTYFTSITWTERAGAAPNVDNNDRFTLPVPDPLIARLRRLVAEPTDATYTDNDLAAALDENTNRLGQVDIYGAAADVWDEKAAVLVQREATDRSLSSVRTGEQGIVYSATTQSAVRLAENRARHFRARSVAKTVPLRSPGTDPRLMRPQQVDAGLGHAYSPEALYLSGVYDT